MQILQNKAENETKKDVLKDAEETTSKELDFTVDDNIINHLISHQAGTIEKAVIELIMNSIDALATKIEIILNDKRIIVKDNGKGFKDEDEILNYFGRFGTPHEDGDSTYGRFRIGRGQLLSFGEASWRSATYKMDVDIKNKGLKYILHKDLKQLNGCEVICNLYEKQRINKIKFSSLFAYSPADIYINGEKISKNPKEEDWDYENDFFYFKKKPYSNNVCVYNQGIFVSYEHYMEFDLRGILVSKLPMEVNFARNDIIRHQCKVWESFADYARGIQRKTIDYSIKKGKDISFFTMENIIKAFLNNELDIYTLINAKFIMDVSGYYHSILDLIKNNIKYFAIGEKNSVLNDSLNQIHGVIIVSDDIYYNYNETFIGRDCDLQSDNLLDLIIVLLTILREKVEEEVDIDNKIIIKTFDSVGYETNARYGYLVNSESAQQFLESIYYKSINHSSDNSPFIDEDIFNTYFAEPVSYINMSFTTIKVLEELYPFSLQYIPYSKLNTFEKAIFRAADKMNTAISYMIKSDRRSLKVGNSHGKVIAWTDGESTITIDINTLRGVEKTISNVEELAFSLIHEYCHNENNEVTNEHGMEFYKSYHDSTFTRGNTIPREKGYSLSNIINTFCSALVSAIIKHGKKIKPEFYEIVYGKKSESMKTLRNKVNNLLSLQYLDNSTSLPKLKSQAKISKKEIMIKRMFKIKNKTISNLNNTIDISISCDDDRNHILLNTDSGNFFIELRSSDVLYLNTLAIQVVYDLQSINCGNDLLCYTTKKEVEDEKTGKLRNISIMHTFYLELTKNYDKNFCPIDYIKLLETKDLFDKTLYKSKSAFYFLYLLYYHKEFTVKTQKPLNIVMHAKYYFSTFISLGEKNILSPQEAFDELKNSVDNANLLDRSEI